ncbi:MAG: hypothetical protein HHJ13_10605 [Phycicoccus sp.]|nr:hypothetical protein [Phycicoccus sp.]
MGEALALNLVTSLIAFAAGWFFRMIYKRRKELTPGAHVWRLNGDLPTSIVTAEGLIIDVQEYKTQTVWPTEYVAATEISLFLADLFRIKIARFCTSSEFARDELLRGNLIVIGGPVRNAVYREVAARIHINYEFQGYDLVRLSDSRVYQAEIVDQELKRDIGLVVLAQNPFNERARLVMVAGCRVFGTLAAARMLINPDVHRIHKAVQKQSQISFVVEADLIDGFAVRTSILDSHPVE